MPSFAWSDVVAAAPSLSSVDPLFQVAIVEHVRGSLDVELWGGDEGEDSYTLYLGRVFLAAHIASSLLSSISGTTGAVIEQTIGPISRKFAQVASTENLGTTGYGAEFLSLLKSLGPAWFVI